MKQFLPPNICLTCTDPCCHFHKGEDEHAPFFTPEQHKTILAKGFDPDSFHFLEERNVWQSKLKEFKGDDYVCTFFIDNKCTVYNDRPIECKLWPFFITFDINKTKVMLSIDLQTFCPGVKKNVLETDSGKDYVKFIMDYLQSVELIDLFSKNPGLIHDYDDQFTYIGELPKLTEVVVK